MAVRRTEPKKGSGNRKLRHRHVDGRAMVRVGRKAADVLEQPASIKEWDDEELERGQRKDKNGQFRGRPPTIVPTECYNELTRRLFSRAEKLMRDNLLEAIEQLTRIAKSDFADDNAKIKAIDMMMNRVLGKVPDKVNLHASVEEPPWLKALQSATVVGEIGSAIDADSEEIES